MKNLLFIILFMLAGCGELTLKDMTPTLSVDPPAPPPVISSSQKMPRSQATGDIFPIPYINPWGLFGLGSDMDQSKEAIFAACTIGILGHIVGSEDSFSTRIAILNLTTGWDTIFHKIGLDPATECSPIKSNGCVWINPDGSPICPSDSFLFANHLWCMPDSSYDEYYNRYPTRSDLLLDTTIVYRYGVYVHLNDPPTIPTFDPRKSVGVFGFSYKWKRNFYGQGFYIPTYDLSFITPAIISRLKNIK